MKYLVEVKPNINTDNEDEQANAEWINVGEYKSKSKAVNIAKSKSKCKKWFESHVVFIPDPTQDPTFDTYYRGGDLEYRMV